MNQHCRLEANDGKVIIVKIANVKLGEGHQNSPLENGAHAPFSFTIAGNEYQRSGMNDSGCS